MEEKHKYDSDIRVLDEQCGKVVASDAVPVPESPGRCEMGKTNILEEHRSDALPPEELVRTESHRNEAALAELLECLEKHRQPATYGAVAGIVGGNYRSLMHGRPRDARNSWVVNKETRRPTGYKEHEMHADLLNAIGSSGVITTPEELDTWLTAHRSINS